MKMRSILILSTIAGLLFSACGISNQSSDHVSAAETSKLNDGVDSIKVEISTKVGGTRSILLKDNANAVARFQNKPDSTLSISTTEELTGLADSLFVEKSCKIIISETAAEGRTDYPIFTVSLYKNGQEETTSYDMGTQEENITHSTTRDIYYSPEFRHFVSTVYDILM